MLLIAIQSISCLLLVFMYIPQISKIFKVKQTKDISLMMYISRISSTLISMYTLSLSNNGLVVILGQYVSLILSLVVFGQMVYYTYIKHTKKSY